MSDSNFTLSVEVLRKLLSYDPSSGHFVWLIKPSFGVSVGDKAGSLTNAGYTAIKISGKNYKAHRLAWLYTYETWPTKHIDHINGNRSDNRLCNLRDVSRSDNAQNQRVAQKGNKSGFLGVSPYRSRWMAQIHIAGKNVYLGLYPTPELASEAYLSEKKKHHIPSPF